MAELKENKRRLSINLSLFGHNDQNTKTITKSPRNFEEPNGVVGLGIVAALHDTDQIHDPFFSAKSFRTAISPRSNPIPVINKTMSFDSSKFETFGRNTFGEVEDMELGEEYTCVISHIGKNVIKKREYFDGDLGNGSTRTSICWVKSGLFSASSPQASSQYDEAEVFHGADFLNSCYLCNKQLHGLDIFMYRGEKAFCSTECRHKQIMIDERQAKHNNSGVMKPLECSVSPCSSPIQYFAGVAMG